ncbi:MAG: Lar family restriction alleviation protein [bacterium]|nr:Lar family restriction alleviation protein [bacterium]
MDIFELVEVNDCPICGGGALLEEECGNSYYVMCMECGAHSVNIDFKTEEERLSAAQRTALLWNTGKVIKSDPGE